MRSSTEPGPEPLIVKTPEEMRALAREWHVAGETIGLVPTMGALHAGHMSLVAVARAETSRVVVSIFVNPLQFGPGEDFERYPRPVESDLAMLREAGVDAVYMPDQSTLYPPDLSTRVHVGGLTETLEGVHRPGHFEGVATVLTKLFWATHADRAYFGQKDAQQVAVVKRLAADLDSGVEIRGCPTIRDADGLAVSSRNAYLSPAERAAALSLSGSLRTAAEMYAAGERDTGRLRTRIQEVLAAEPLVSIDYAELVDPSTFRPPGMLAVLAVRIGKTRLIDNHDVSKTFPG